MFKVYVAWLAATALVGLSGCGSDGEPAQALDGGGGIDSGPRFECEPGQTRVAVCGRCGSVSERCSDTGMWTPISECLGEGECQAGLVENRTSDRCAVEQRLCSATCAWTEWEEVSPERGACVAGQTRAATDVSCTDSALPARRQRCDAVTCEWVAEGPCVDECGGAARTSPRLSAEVCVPAGDFIRGQEGLRDATPVATVTLDAFYIDRYPVTNARYRACMDAGVCADPEDNLAERARSVLHDNYPVSGVTWIDMNTFCEWDGRRLPTEAEWEKAARGPAPDTRRYPWGDEFSCDALYARRHCRDAWMFPWEDFPSDEVDDYPLSASPYGAELMLGGVFEWVSDWYAKDYYSDPTSLINPRGGPASFGTRSCRGAARTDINPSVDFISTRKNLNPTATSFVVGGRCARTP